MTNDKHTTHTLTQLAYTQLVNYKLQQYTCLLAHVYALHAIATSHECSDLCVLFLLIFISTKHYTKISQVFIAIRWLTAFIVSLSHTHAHMTFIM